jgi:hypothetical protein
MMQTLGYTSRCQLVICTLIPKVPLFSTMAASPTMYAPANARSSFKRIKNSGMQRRADVYMTVCHRVFLRHCTQHVYSAHQDVWIRGLIEQADDLHQTHECSIPSTIWI